MPVVSVGYVLIALFTNMMNVPTTSLTAYFADEQACDAAQNGLRKNAKPETIAYMACIPQKL